MTVDDDYQVETGDIAISDVLLKIAAETGWEIWHGMKLGTLHYPYVLLKSGRKIDWNGGWNNSYSTISIPDAIKKLRDNPFPPPPPICIGNKSVEFKTDGIKVGCEFIDIKTVDAIHERLHSDDKSEPPCFFD